MPKFNGISEKAKAIISAIILIIIFLAGCSEVSPPPNTLVGNGFEASYTASLWQKLKADTTTSGSETLCIDQESDTFFTVFRFTQEVAESEGLTTPEGIRILLDGYVTSYTGRNAKYDAAGSVYLLRFSYTYSPPENSVNAGREETGVFLAKVILSENDGVLVCLASYHDKTPKQLLSDVESVVSSIILTPVVPAESTE